MQPPTPSPTPSPTQQPSMTNDPTKRPTNTSTDAPPPHTADVHPIVWLHGYGSCAANMEAVALALQDKRHPSIVLDAPYACEDYPQGRQWFSLKHLPWGAATVQQAWRPIDALITEAAHETYQRIRSVIPSGPFWLAGFSQGAMMAYEMGFFCPGVIGVLGFSGAYDGAMPPVYRPKLFWAHCQDDAVVPYAWMVQSHDRWQSHGLKADRCVIPQGGHTITSEHLHHARAFVQAHDG